MYVERFPSEEIGECILFLFHPVYAKSLLVTHSMFQVLVALCHSFNLADHFRILPYLL